MNVREALREAAELLNGAGIASAQSKAEWTLAQALHCGRFDLTANPARPITESQLHEFRAYCRRLAAHEPLQYVLGNTDFMGLNLKTDPRALIPRPETEQLVDRILCADFWRRVVPGCGVDIGTGSGCIVLALASRHPEWRWMAVDREPEALTLARENARVLGMESAIEWRLGDLLESFEEDSLDLVVSNPPYIVSAVCDALSPEVRDYEPRAALDGGADGLELLRRLISRAAVVLRKGGHIYLEIGWDQGHRTAALLEQAGFKDVAVHPDLAGRDRVAEGIKA